MADRDAILDPYIELSTDLGNRGVSPENTKEVMDSYMKSTCLELLEYMAKHGVRVSFNIRNEPIFEYKGEWISKEQLFENFI